ncbi:MAG: SDR family oxidoreductase [Paenibacillaceae bacterium]|nr:SDR family oxidoreductase [Paenibacillaceae bacterium]
MTLVGKTAIVTGSTSGIGEAIAEKLAGRGVKVAVTGRDETRGRQVAERLQAQGGEAIFVRADLSDPAAPERIVAAAAAAWGRIDIVVNNAALISNKPLEQVVHGDWDSLFTVNLKSAFFVVQAALPYLTASRGCVINVGSTNSLRNSRDNLVYDTMKAALNHMTRGLAMELKDRGIRVNALLPGGTVTPALTRWLETYTGSAEEGRRMLDKELGEGIVALPEQIADGVLMLADERSSWINGAAIPIDGGAHLT